MKTEDIKNELEKKVLKKNKKNLNKMILWVREYSTSTDNLIVI